MSCFYCAENKPLSNRDGFKNICNDCEQTYVSGRLTTDYQYREDADSIDVAVYVDGEFRNWCGSSKAAAS